MVQFFSVAKLFALLVLTSGAMAEPRERQIGHAAQLDKYGKHVTVRAQGYPPTPHQQGDDRKGRNPRHAGPDTRQWAPGRGSYFTPDHNERARHYFDMPDHRGFVPPGLVKKGGMPPGQAKKWQIGRPLPRGVVFYELPRPLVISLGLPPPGYRYVRVATDILLIAIGTRIVIDALENMAR